LLQLLPGQASAQTLFTDATGEIGAEMPFPCRAVAFGDYDNDGRPDIFLSENSRQRRISLLHNDGGGQFTDRTDAIHAVNPPVTKGGGAIFGDYDNDGDLDLYVPVGDYRWGYRGRNLLLRNDRGTFTDVALEAGLADRLPTDNAIWLDYDRDGHLDLYTGNQAVISLSDEEGDPTVRNKLYRNNGDGTFADVTEQVGLDMPLHPQFGALAGGMAAGDFNDDRWPDLYVAVGLAPNRLFLSDGHGRFVDATTGDIADPGDAFGVAVGDIDNDGDLDLFQAAGGLAELEDLRSLMLMNLGKGEFLDITEGVGLSEMVTYCVNPTLADIDNDGDVDLMLAKWEDIETSERDRAVFMNGGDGTFDTAPSTHGLSPPPDPGAYLSVGDYTGNGFLDVWFGGAVSRNSGNDNHWLRVELVGVASNRNGIGARLVALSGDLQQMREILGGNGFTQDELVAHFGMGEHTQVDRLEIRWPSGQVDVLTDIPADQKIRVLEGGEAYHEVVPTVWEHDLPDSLVAGGVFRGTVRVRPALFEPQAQITRVVADLSELGGAESVALEASEDGTWQLEPTLDIPRQNGYRTVEVMIDQSTSVGDHWTQLSHKLLVLPARNEAVFVDGVGGGWSLGPAETGTEQKLGFVTYVDGTRDIYLVNEHGSNQVRLTQDEGNMVITGYGGLKTPTWDWSPDGRQLVLVSDRDGPPAIYTVDADGTQLRQLTLPGEGQYDLQPSWSPDGTRIAFCSNRTGNEEIWVMDTDGGNPVQLTDHPARDATPCWSPDGTRLAFATLRHGDEGEDNREIYVMDADGSNPVRLTQSLGNDHSPSWSPDGTRIAFRTSPTGADVPTGIIVMDADGSNPTPLPGAETGWRPSWSPDGAKIAFYDGEGGIFTVGPDGSGLARAVRVPTGVWVWSPVWLPGSASAPVQVLNTKAPAVTYQGRRAREMRSDRAWLATYQTATPVVLDGYESLSFAFHPGDATLPEGGWLKLRAMPEGGWLELQVGRGQLDLLEGWISVTQREWQEVEISVEKLGLEGPLEQIDFSGVLTGTFYLADVELITGAEGLPVTAVAEEQTGLPGRFALDQNYPNPFNSNTVIRFTLPRRAEAGLSIYNLAGQQVATLAEGSREAGTHTVRWDGRDNGGRELASGVYLCRLQAGTHVRNRKLLLLR